MKKGNFKPVTIVFKVSDNIKEMMIKFKNNKFLSKLFVNILFYRNIVCLKL